MTTSIVVPKSVLDFHSVGAIWVDPGTWTTSTRTSIETQIPQILSGVEEGTIKAHPLDTDAWNNLESIVKELTTSPRSSKTRCSNTGRVGRVRADVQARATWRPRPGRRFWSHAGAALLGGCTRSRRWQVGWTHAPLAPSPAAWRVGKTHAPPPRRRRESNARRTPFRYRTRPRGVAAPARYSRQPARLESRGVEVRAKPATNHG